MENMTIVLPIEINEAFFYGNFFCYLTIMLATLFGYYIFNRSIWGALLFQTMAIGFLIIFYPYIVAFFSIPM